PRISPLEGRVPLINSVAFSPDGIWVASASGFDNAAVRVWNATTGERLHLRLTSIHALAAGISPDGRTSPRHALSVAFSPDGRRIASGTSEGRVQVWDVKTGEPLGSLTGHTGGATGLAFSPDGHRIASSAGVIEVWVADPAIAQEPLTFKGHTGTARRVTFSPDGTRLASAGADGTIKVWDARSDPEAHILQGNVTAFSLDGQRLAPVV